jgi:hypothetical protein
MVLMLRLSRRFRDVRSGTPGISIGQENTKPRSTGTEGMNVIVQVIQKYGAVRKTNSDNFNL